jgi:peptide deformylase
MIKKIVPAKNPILRIKSKTIEKFDKKINILAQDLEDTLLAQRDPEGIGLAAPQIGVHLRIFAMLDGKKIRVIANPKVLVISSRSTKKKKKPGILEGCLSIPYYYGPVKRADKIKISYQNLNGKQETEEFKDLSAQIVQHEIDHLEGKLFIDHLLIQKKPLYKISGDEWEEVDFVIK